MARREIKSGGKREVETVGPQESASRYLEPQIIPFLQTIFNTPKMLEQSFKEVQQNGPFAAPSPEVRSLAGGTSTDTGNRLLNALLDAAKMTQTSTRAGAEVGTGATAIKSLIPYLTYGGVNKLKDTLASKDPNAWTGKDIQDSLVEKLTAGNKLGNVKSDVETFVNDLLTRRMPGGFSNQQTYGAGEVNQLAKNIGTAETGGYDYSSVPGMVRSAATSLIKDVVPETKLPYQAATILNKIGSVPGVGWLLKNPVTWPVAGLGAEKIPGVVKSIFK